MLIHTVYKAGFIYKKTKSNVCAVYVKLSNTNYYIFLIYLVNQP